MLVLLPVLIVVMVSFLLAGMALPVLPLHITQQLHFGTTTVGTVAGTEFAAGMVSRFWAGNWSDRKGPKQAVMGGTAAVSVTGVFYILSVLSEAVPTLSIALLYIGRALLGCGESLIITGALTWGLALLKGQRAGNGIGWIGAALYAALALGGPIGTIIYDHAGIMSMSLVMAIVPLPLIMWMRTLPSVMPTSKKRSLSLISSIQAAWVPGIGFGFCTIGYGAMLTYASLLYAEHHWHPVWLPFAAFGGTLLLIRILWGSLPDRFGGAKVALLFALLEGMGFFVMCNSSTVWGATLGAALAGAGFSFSFPAFGVELLKNVAPEHRGMVLGACDAFGDATRAISGPLLGLLAASHGLGSAFLTCGILSWCGALVALTLLKTTSPVKRN